MYICAYPHRRQLMQITQRWISDRLEADDPVQITRILTYDSFVAWHSMVDFVQALTRRLGPGPEVHRLPLYSKKDLKDFITSPVEPTSARVAELIRTYRRTPEFFYVGSPMAGYLFHDPRGRVLSLCRFKRIKRIAEKASRYAALYMGDCLQRSAETLGLEAAGGGPGALPLAGAMAEAERRLASEIRQGSFTLPQEKMQILDVVGAKIIDRGFGPEGLEAAIAQWPGAAILEKEIHRGAYNAIHYTVRLDINPQAVIKAFCTSPHKATYRRRGLTAGEGNGDFEKFLATGAGHLSLDLILTTFEELIESEIGRSMHEARIFRQRREGAVYGNIPVNIEYILEYLLAVGLSPAVQIDEIPIKIWGRYLPDTLSFCIQRLYGIPEFSLTEG